MLRAFGRGRRSSGRRRCSSRCSRPCGPARRSLRPAFPRSREELLTRRTSSRPVTKADLERKLADLEQKSRIELVVATVPSLDGEEIEPYANGLFRAWKLGEAKDNNGALLLIAPKERRVRIEVGYGLEGTLTDAVSSIIISNAIAPRFKAGDFNGGVTAASTTSSPRSDQSAEWKPKPADMRAEHEASLLDTLAPFLIFLFIMFVISRISRRGAAATSSSFRWAREDSGAGFAAAAGSAAAEGLGAAASLAGGVFRRRRRLGRLVMILDPEAAERVETAYDTAQLETRAPLVCVLAGASTSLDGEFLLGACILALATPLPLLCVHQPFRPPHLRRSAAGGYSRRRAGLAAAAAAVAYPETLARSAGHRAALAQFVLRGSTARVAARSSMCRWPNITSALFQPRMRRASSPRRNGKPPSMRRWDRSPPERQRPRSRARGKLRRNSCGALPARGGSGPGEAAVPHRLSVGQSALTSRASFSPRVALAKRCRGLRFQPFSTRKG